MDGAGFHAALNWVAREKFEIGPGIHLAQRESAGRHALAAFAMAGHSEKNGRFGLKADLPAAASTQLST
jgi:hypothetical protein